MTLLLQRRERLPEPVPKNVGPFPTFLLTLPALSHSNVVLRAFERAITRQLGGGFTSWDARGAWHHKGEFVFENVRLWLVATEKEHVLRGIYRAVLDELGEKEGFFVSTGTHTIV